MDDLVFFYFADDVVIITAAKTAYVSSHASNRRKQKSAYWRLSNLFSLKENNFPASCSYFLYLTPVQLKPEVELDYLTQCLTSVQLKSGVILYLQLAF